MLRFEDAEGDCVTIASTWKAKQRAKERDRDVQVGPVDTYHVATQSVTYADADMQTNFENDDMPESKSSSNEEDIDENRHEEKEENAHGPEVDEDDMAAWLARTMHDIGDELDRREGPQMREAVPSVVRADPFHGAESLGQGREGQVYCTIARPMGSLEEADDLGCTSVSWNATGSRVVASYGRFDNYGWCAHRGSVCLWHAFDKDPEELSNAPPDFRFEVECGVMCAQAHPTRPSIVAAGSFNGEILVLDFNQDDPLVACSRIDAYCHREPVMQVRWIPHAGAEGDYLLASVSAEGRVLVWSPFSTLSGPLQGIVLASEARAKRTLGGITLDLCRANGQGALTFLVGSEGGALCRCSARPMPDLARGPKARASLGLRSSKWSADAQDVLLAAEPKDRAVLKQNAERHAELENIGQIDAAALYEASRAEHYMYRGGVRFKYQPHVGPVHAVACSPFHRNAFLSCGADGHLRLYSLLERGPVLDLTPRVAAAHGLFGVACAGKVFVYDLAQSEDAPVAVVQAAKDGKTALQSLAFNGRTRGFVACGDAAGQVSILKLPWKLSNRQPDDKTALDVTMFSSSSSSNSASVAAR
ncbi:Dynein intermediate chain 1 [Hondaea fermentalgiana]|uniref:Dynein intermediate chain 1 n=1 Tax=Hondaea fermentalgiana TaxID=2315210 RepID=A0A2R5GP94_9STRA|nr:Dynein intermediate chain 1 [Hondaea fermentalgiana]|eukprot:GBG31598.1 Dynein intermediate chain 1 [Hondaea fermentalgiana]